LCSDTWLALFLCCSVLWLARPLRQLAHNNRANSEDYIQAAHR
jgi:hypothetical protein